jgi:hypothetical protein
LGSFSVKCASITNLAAFQAFVTRSLARKSLQMPEFQLNHDSIGDDKDSTRCKRLY